MSDKPKLMRAFNALFFDFLDDIIRIFPENKDIVISRNSFDTIKKLNPTLLIKAWDKFVYSPYQQAIDDGDIRFFYEKDYSSDLSQLSNSGEIMKIIDTLRNPVRDMTEVNKSHSMKYIQNLSKLSALYNQL